MVLVAGCDGEKKRVTVPIAVPVAARHGFASFLDFAFLCKYYATHTTTLFYYLRRTRAAHETRHALTRRLMATLDYMHPGGNRH